MTTYLLLEKVYQEGKPFFEVISSATTLEAVATKLIAAGGLKDLSIVKMVDYKIVEKNER
jgi:hypothetical protein